MAGLFITFEGPDGAGKTTQLTLLAEALKASGYDVTVTREPGGTLISDRIRRIILDPDHQSMRAQTEVLLYAASRAQHVLEKIKPALAQGKIVLCDRFVDASIAYQGYGLGVGEEQVRMINQFATQGLVPHKTFLLDIAAEEGRRRLAERKQAEFKQGLDRIEQKDLAYHERVRRGFLRLAEQEDRIVLIDASQPVEVIHQQILREVRSLLQQKA
ncbi:Thymidylate kinase [Caldalkalibacillus thermarum TA2.A1]|uniref:Thymidylate kinase n=1 Tax=Caldalkalibacillus thermarum (strain TA2.A1) TaxID=986075 RepID=F5L9X0_CALTT|nr:dTMP kinase [Caldalkalibacillus thermarum]EGL81840.1 Thymidylate kinase [Caldalkalibacillus thermarum TA2.A1]QZT34329.1 dTMP kinase [Caldalkalibacillus thermarum TA2.A1]GGK31903.1 thymidylate kinase [Caldalkalibacillus thermarum]